MQQLRPLTGEIALAEYVKTHGRMAKKLSGYARVCSIGDGPIGDPNVTVSRPDSAGTSVGPVAKGAALAMPARSEARPLSATLEAASARLTCIRRHRCDLM